LVIACQLFAAIEGVTTWWSHEGVGQKFTLHTALTIANSQVSLVVLVFCFCCFCVLLFVVLVLFLVVGGCAAFFT